MAGQAFCTGRSAGKSQNACFAPFVRILTLTSDATMDCPMQRVMIVDDDVHVCETLSRVLEHVGIAHEVYQNAKSAARAAAVFLPDAAIIDFVLPDTDGISLAQQMKVAYPNLHVVMISGILDFEQDLGNLARASGVNAFVEKPFVAAEIVAALES